jgi:hypothetical protein
MSNYVQELWQDQTLREQRHGKAGRAVAWTLGIVAAILIAAFFSQNYWYPYLQPYLHR